MSMMDVLNNFDKASFTRMAKFSVPNSIGRSIEKNIKTLVEISESLWGKAEAKPSEDVIVAIRKKLSKENSVFSYKECRIMSLYPKDVSEDVQSNYIKIVGILEKNWTNAFLRRLLHFVVVNWNETTARSDKSYCLYELFLKKIETYNGNIDKLIYWKEKREFFSEEGPLKIGQLLREQNQDSPLAAIDQLKFPESYFTASYFRDVIRCFYYGINEIPKDLETVLKRHEDSETTKIVLSDLIIRTRDNAQLLYQKKSLQYLALNLVGHPKSGSWISCSRDSKIRDKIKDAVKIINQWLVEVYVEEIFTNFICDPARKKYWMKYAKAGYIEDVKVVGCREIGNRLRYCESLRDSLEYCYIQTTKSENQCAFVMNIHGFNVIEFSESGAIYIYPNNTRIERLRYSRSSQLGDLKTPNIPYGLRSAGISRLAHRGYWEWELDHWFQNYRGVNV